MDELFPIGIVEQIACIAREIEMRRSTYPRWVAAKKMTEAKARKELAAMEAVLTTLKGIPP